MWTRTTKFCYRYWLLIFRCFGENEYRQQNWNPNIQSYYYTERHNSWITRTGLKSSVADVTSNLDTLVNDVDPTTTKQSLNLAGVRYKKIQIKLIHRNTRKYLTNATKIVLLSEVMTIQTSKLFLKLSRFMWQE